MSTRAPKKTATAQAAAQVVADAQQQPGEGAPGGQDDTAAEEAAHLQRLQATAAEAEEQPGGPGPVDAAPEAPAVNLEAEIAALAKVTVAMLAPMFPSLREVYTDETIAAAAGVAGPLCRKHGWLPDGIGGKYAEELAAAAVLVPIGVATYAGVRRDLAEQRRKAANAGEAVPLPDLSAPVPTEAPAPAKTVTFGAPIPAEASA